MLFKKIIIKMSEIKILEISDINETLIETIKDFSLLPNKRIGWNYPLDYSFLANEFTKIENSINNKMKILDIGCGPGAIHGYLENKYNINIEGIDMQHWEKDYVDYIGNFLDDKLINNEYDIIYSISAFEHQSKEEHIKCIEKSKRLLKKGGYLFVTAAVCEKTNNSKNQLNLSLNELEEIYSCDFKKNYNIKNINEDYKQNFKDDLIKRYGNDSVDFLTFGYMYKKE